MYTKRERRRSTVVGAYNLHHEECSFRFYLTRLTFTRYTFSSFSKHRCFINSKCTIDMFVLRIAFVIFHTSSAQLSLKSTSNFTYGFITVLSSTLEFYFFIVSKSRTEEWEHDSLLLHWNTFLAISPAQSISGGCSCAG